MCLRLFVSMNYAIAKRCCLQQIAIDFLKDSDPILGQLIDRIGACQLNQHELEGDLLCMPILGKVSGMATGTLN